MTIIKWIIVLSVFIITAFSTGTGQELNSPEFIEEEILQNSDTRKAADQCDTGSCRRSKCNCCQGYGVNPSIFGDSCKKCECRKSFGCEFSKVLGSKTCLCTTGYTEKSGSCKADCRKNPCKNGGICKVVGLDLECNCPKFYSGEFCEKGNPCSSNPCKNGGTCVPSGDKETCQCPIQFTGNTCETDKCSILNCGKNGKCIVKGGNAVCNCTDEYMGKNCETQKCSLLSCGRNGKCIVKGGNAVCNCTDEYMGKNCETKKCSLIKCENSGTCAIKDGTTICVCTERYTGKNCEIDKCADIKCQNNGTCIMKGNKAVCLCSDRFTGEKCQTDKCTLINCQHGGQCNIKDKKAICVCTEDYAGEYCEKHKCSLIECKNGGQCEMKKGNATCNCADRYTGVYCDIDKCTTIKCENGGTCDIRNGKAVCNCTDAYIGDKCEKKCNCKNGKCNVLSGKIECNCYPEFGKYKTDECKACDCGKGANCTFKPGGIFSTDKKSCICPIGFKEKDGVCVDPDIHNPCRDNPCKNGASCKKDGINAKCICLPGYNGKLCENDVCKPNSCENGGTCKRDTGKPVCLCKDAYTGDKCQTGKCSLISCKNGGKCKIVNKNATCICPDNYTGDTCETEKCSMINCQNGGKCEVKNKVATCMCLEKYTGTFCETEKCSSIKCQNGGKCYIKNSSAACNCTDNFTGELCEIELPITATPKTTSITASTTEQIKLSTPNTPNTTTPTTSTTEQTKSSTDVNTDPTERRTTEIATDSTSTRELVTDNNTLSTAEYVTDNDTISTTDLVTDNITLSTTESFENKTLNTSSELITFTTEPVKITTPTTSKEETTATTKSGDNECERNFCKNGGTCIKDNGVEKCVCRYPFAGKTCEADYWCTGIGKELCNEQKCTFDYNTRIGRCVCPNGQYFDYNKRMCQSVDKCPLTPEKCTKPNEECRNNTCECKDNYKRNTKNQCVPNFCEKYAKTVCKSNSECKENEKDPENVLCQCKSGYVFSDDGCVEVDKCRVPGILGCQQICEPKTETCKCFPGYEIQEDKKSCKLKNESYRCSKDCKPGVCSKIGKDEICYCPVTHVNKNGTCKDLCTAGSLPKNMCPENMCEPHSDLGFRCKCNGKWKYDVNKVTCMRKLMCTEEGGIEICANKSAKCVEDDKLGFNCVCAETEEMDTDGICKNKCELKKYQDSCRGRLAECDMQGSEVTCKCPTLLTFNDKDVCTELAASFSGEIPFFKEKYTSKTLYSPGGNVSGLNYEKMKQDFRNSMQLIYGKNYRFADIKSCKDTEIILTCSVEIQFNTDPKDQYKLIGSSETCLPGDSNTCLIPPELVLVKKAVNTDLLSQTDPCTENLKQMNCGGNETVCRNTTSDNRNFECTCAEGFESYSTVYPVSDPRTVIHKCQDINECQSQKACPNRTRCLNTYGSYECLCEEGFKPVNSSLSTKQSGCVAVCGPGTCINGDCERDGFFYTCRCTDGYSGPDCKQKIERSEEPKGAQIALIALSTIVVPLALFSAYMVHKYKILNRKLQNANFLDDNSSTISMEPLRTGLKP